MRAVVSFPGVMAQAQELARAFDEAGRLDVFATTLAFPPAGKWGPLDPLRPAWARRLDAEIGRRRVESVPWSKVRVHPAAEALRTVLWRAGAGPTLVSRAWDASVKGFDRAVAERYVPKTQTIVAFEYAALESFRRAEALGVARVLNLMSLGKPNPAAGPRQEVPRKLQKQQDYFLQRLERRYLRRVAEIEAADVVIANSALTKRTHVEAGADPAKIVVVPLGAPPPIAAVTERPTGGPLQVMFAGQFSYWKGARHLVEGWRALNAGANAHLTVYGSVALAPKPLEGLEGVSFMGSRPRAEVLAAFEQADVLVFPTLLDGFGMVVTEALSRGAPVITTDRAGAADLITPGLNGLLVPAANGQALKDALQWCLDNRQALAAMRPQALASARAYQWSDYRAAVMDAMDTALRARGYPAP